MPKTVGGRPIPEQIYELVRRRPRSADDLIAAIWWLHPQDAPRREAIKAHIWHLNQRLKSRRERVISTGWGGEPRVGTRESLYRLVTLG